jgi:WD40 repeat protein
MPELVNASMCLTSIRVRSQVPSSSSLGSTAQLVLLTSIKYYILIEEHAKSGTWTLASAWRRYVDIKMKCLISHSTQQVRGYSSPKKTLLGTRLVTASADSTARVYNVHTGECISDLQGHAGEISKVSFNPSGNQIITGSADSTAKILYI